MNTLPNVLICDDEDDWVDLITKTIRPKFCAVSTTNPKDWNEHISGPRWDAIIIDVQLIGTRTTGIDHAVESILEYGVVTSIIITSGHVNLDQCRKEHGKIFFDYISKNYIEELLLAAVENACTDSTQLKHAKNVLTSFSKKLNKLESRVPPSMLEDYDYCRQIFESNGGETVKDLIDCLHGTKPQMRKMSKIIFEIIRS